MTIVKWIRVGLIGFSALLANVNVSAGSDTFLSDEIIPDPKLSPRQVVELQLEALRHNDKRDRGIAVAFRFASPTNRAQTGPLERFSSMIRAGGYALMLNYREAVFEEAQIEGRNALQTVMLVGSHQTVRYVFHLGLQSKAPYDDCWMTEGVSVSKVEGSMAQLVPTHGFDYVVAAR